MTLAYKTEGTAISMPAGTLPKFTLPAEPEHTLKIVADCGAGQYMIEYPDGYRKVHQGYETAALLAKINGTMRARYNVTDFQFKAVPKALIAGEIIIIGEVKYA